MNKISKKIVALVTMAAFVLTLVPVAAFAASEDTVATASNFKVVAKTAAADAGNLFTKIVPKVIAQNVERK